MTDAEIIKALECCSSTDSYCSACPYCGEPRTCVVKKSKDALDLINRLKADNERLKKENHRFADIGKMYSEIKSEARKEFAEMLCADRVSNDPVVIAVKAELKEMG